MLTSSILAALDLAGVFVFALSGGLTAVRHKLDFFGVIVVALLPAVGGGTLRDVLLDQPVFWLSDERMIVLAALAGVAAFFLPNRLSRMAALVWFDAVGLALFAAVGASKAYALGHGPIVTVMMGTMTATAGGLIRDVICNETPMLLREGELYATAAIAGGFALWAASALGAGAGLAMLVGAAVAFAVRAAGLVFKLRLPVSPGN